ncbi:unnamed protein product, partial [Caenorhabditis auriculariae]
ENKVAALVCAQMIESLMCTICLQTSDRTRIAVPCGHILCSTCAERVPVVKMRGRNVKKCPTCATKIMTVVGMPNKQHNLRKQ